MSFEDRVRGHWPDLADEILDVIRSRRAPTTYPQTQEWVRRCYHEPSVIEQKMSALNEIIGGFGTEAIFGDDCYWPDAEYVNLGDTYATTILFDYVHNSFRVISWGDWIEFMEGKGYSYA